MDYKKYHFPSALTLIIIAYILAFTSNSQPLLLSLALGTGAILPLIHAKKDLLLVIPGIIILGLTFSLPQPWPAYWFVLPRFAVSIILWVTLMALTWRIQQFYLQASDKKEADDK